VFVDVGVHQDGLVHISRLANHFVKDPNDVVKVNQKVKVTVLDIDLERNRVSLSMTGAGSNDSAYKAQKTSVKTRTQEKVASKSYKPRRDQFNNPFAQAFKGR
jgi:uncharacterized protein